MLRLGKHKTSILFILTFMLISILIFKSFSVYISSNEFLYFDNTKGHITKIIPNIIHYIIFGKRTIEFSGYLSILGSIKFQKPTVLYIHSDQLHFTGENWNKILQLNATHPVIKLNYISQPTHVYGQPISSVYHATDIARIKVLQQWGGIYLDTDVLILKCLDPYRHFEMVIGWPEHAFMGTQILLAHKNARFLRAWLHGYKRYMPRNWYYNAGQYPTEQILKKMSYLVHRVPEQFGVQNLQNELYNTNNWTEWKQYYAVHLLSRHPPAPYYLNESLIHHMNNSFKNIATYILYS